MQSRRIIFIPVLLLLFLPTPLLAQTTSTILGTVRDTSRAVIPGVLITATHVGTNISRTVITDELGNYVIPFLAVGEYEVTGELAGFQKAIRRIVLQVDQRARVDLSLEVGAFTQIAEVVAETALLKTDSSEIGAVIENKRIVELPLNGRNFIALNALDAGAATRTGARGSYFQLFGGNYSFSGSPGDSSTYSADGIAMKGQGDARVTMKITIDTIQEFKQQQGLFSAESGGGGGNVNVVTKGGSNEFHWSAWEFLRNSAFDARNFFDVDKPPFKLNQFGATVGGPLAKDRTFFFGSYEGTRSRKSVGQIFSVPSLEDRNGDFRGRRTIYDPATIRPDPGRPGQFIRDPFPNNVIPPDRIDPVARRILDLMFPLPNQPGRALNLQAPLRNEVDEDQFTVRVDHRFSNKNTVFVRYTLTDPRRYNTTFAQLPNYADYWNTRAQNVAITDTHVLSSRIVNELRVGFNRMYQYLVSTETRNMPEVLGITGTQGHVYPGPPTISISGYNRTAALGNTPNNRAEDTFQLIDNVSYTLRNHALGFGVDFKKLRENGGNASGSRGSFTFSQRFTTLPGVANTGEAMADFLLGYPTNASVGLGNGYTNIRQFLSAFYIKDDWQVSPRLTLNLGVRYEYFSPLTEVRDRIPSFDYVRGELVPVGQGGVSRNLYEKDWNNFAPRFGFAYQPFGNAKTVLRGGYGVFYSAPMPYMGWSAGSGTLLQSANVVSDPTFPNITIGNAFPQNLLQVSRSVTLMNRNLRTPYNQQWTLGLQREIVKEFVLDVSYVGNKGTKLISGSQKNINQAIPGPGAVAARRPYPTFSNISMFESDGLSIYHGLRSGLQRRFTGGFSLNVSHTWSKMIDVTGTAFLAESGNNAKRDVRNRRAERGRSIFDARQRFVVSYVLELPFEGPLLGGWQVSGVTTLQTGTPVDTGVNFDSANTGSTGDSRPDLIGNPNNGPKTPQQWFNVNAFARPPQFSFGNAGKNIITGPGINNFDFSLSKNFRVRESGQIQFRAEVFNLMNHANFDAPNATFGNAQFGAISSAADPREIQFGLKFVF
ncbi:MAG: TonB-dependent receptor [Acidobacteria bacterium]|nr:TonB-dependent receptor [Acidobacteriota bacterium]